MNSVSVITGGAGGMGLATAKAIGREYDLVLCDVRQDRLDAAVDTLHGLGMDATAINCDVTDHVAVADLMDMASALGTVVSVVHTAGVSPSMGAADYVMRTNAIGTVNVSEAFYRVAGDGAAIVNVASMASYMLPESLVPTAQFPLALQDVDLFMTEMASVCGIAPEEARSGLAYSVSKAFVRWEADAGAGAMVADFAVPRWGRAQEMADLFAFCISDKAGYLTGTDILNDGGVMASMRERTRQAAENG